jgi:hypothetical protein
MLLSSRLPALDSPRLTLGLLRWIVDIAAATLTAGVSGASLALLRGCHTLESH